VTVAERYFSALKIPLLSGRGFTANDNKKAPGVLLVNKAFADAYLGEGNAVGKRIRFTYCARIRSSRLWGWWRIPRPWTWRPVAAGDLQL
jgi:hypothetical protein